jgi:glycosyltransferase involved in cell wall biosynthesis
LFKYASGIPGHIGEVKDYCTKLCHGDYLIELDHDDELFPNAIEEVVNAFKDPEIGMVYSNCTMIKPDGTFHRYGGNFWKDQFRVTEVNGKFYDECINPNIYESYGKHFFTSHAWRLTTSPNHLRAYRRSELIKLGGINGKLHIADDLDIMMRMYLYSKCHHIDKLLYIQHMGDTATKVYNKSIQDHVLHVQDRYGEFAKIWNERNNHA